MKPARIIIDQFQLPVREWCWRENWETGLDSSYSLLCKFAHLNSLTASEIAKLFISATCGRKTAILRNPDEDLRDATVFNIQAIAKTLRMDADLVRRSFLYELLPNSKQKSSDHLRWCPLCALTGFHSPLFQIEIITACPAHGNVLRSRCGQCHKQIPYRFQRETFITPFACPHCKEDIGPALRDPSVKSLRLHPQDKAILENLTDLMRFENDILPIKIELNRKRKAAGLGEFVISSASWRRIEANYVSFVSHVLNALSSEETEAGQMQLNFEHVDEIRRGSKREEPNPYRKPKKSSGIRKKSDGPLPYIRHSWDARLLEIYTLYSAIRRHVRRHIVCSHRMCIETAGRHFWWHMEGEKTRSFCPIAEAYLRWRMYWEGCGIPSQLFGPPTKLPYGIVGWLAQAAPICPADWSHEGETWVIKHLFSFSCMATFQEFSAIALQNAKKRRVAWNKGELAGIYKSNWAISGKDTDKFPISIFRQVYTVDDTLQKIMAYIEDKNHYMQHESALQTIKR